MTPPDPGRGKRPGCWHPSACKITGEEITHSIPPGPPGGMCPWACPSSCSRTCPAAVGAVVVTADTVKPARYGNKRGTVAQVNRDAREIGVDLSGAVSWFRCSEVRLQHPAQPLCGRQASVDAEVRQ